MSVSKTQHGQLISKADIHITNKATKIARTLAITLIAVAVIGGLAVLSHGSFASIGSDMLIFGGASAVLTGSVYAGLHFIRDRREKKKVRKELNIDSWDQTSTDGQISKSVGLNKKQYTVTITYKQGTASHMAIRNGLIK